LKVPQVGHKVLVLNLSILKLKENNFPWWHIWVDPMSIVMSFSSRALAISHGVSGDFFFAMVVVLQEWWSGFQRLQIVLYNIV
jgi:hypothetical protein